MEFSRHNLSKVKKNEGKKGAAAAKAGNRRVTGGITIYQRSSSTGKISRIVRTLASIDVLLFSLLIEKLKLAFSSQALGSLFMYILILMSETQMALDTLWL